MSLKVASTSNGLPILNFNQFTKESNYQDFKERLINYCFTNLRYMATAIRENKAKVFTPLPAPDPNADALTIHNYKKDDEELRKTKDEWIRNNSILLGVILDHLQMSFRQFLEMDSEFINAINEESGIKVWSIITKHVISGTSNETDLMKQKRLNEALNACRQGNSEPDSEFIHRFRQCIKNFPDSGTAAAPENKLQALIFIDNLNNRQHGDFKTYIETQRLQGTAHPDTLDDAITKFNQYVAIITNNTSRTTSTIHHSRKKFFCSYCQMSGHSDSHCFKKNKKNQNSTQQQPPQQTHVIAPTTSTPTDPPSISFPGRGGRGRGRGRGRCRGGRSSFKQNPQNRSNHLTLTSQSSLHEDFASDYPVRVLSLNNRLNMNHIIYDSGAQVSVFKNKDLLENIRNATVPMNIEGIIDGLPIRCNLIGDFLNFGTVYYNEDACANVLSAHQLYKNSSNINFNFANNSYEITDSNDQIFIFEALDDLYILDFEKINKIYTGIISTKDIKLINSINEYREKLGYCSYEKLAQMVRNGTFSFPFGTKDVYDAMRYYGKTIADIKGKSKKKTPQFHPTVELNDLNSIKTQVLEIDIIIVENQHYLVSIALPMKLMSIEYLPTSPKSSSSLKTAIDKHISKFNSHNFTITQIKCDEEPGIIALKNYYSNCNIELLPGSRNNKNTCTPTLDVMIRILKEKVRSIIHSLQYILPLNLLKYCFIYAITRMNMVSSTTSQLAPREILTGRKLNFSKDLRSKFGDIVQIIDPDGDNTLKERSITCITLHPALDEAGSSFFWPLKSNNWNLIKRSIWTITPLNDSIIHYINNLSMNKPHIKLDKSFRSIGSSNKLDDNIIQELYGDIANYQLSLNQRHNALNNLKGNNARNINNTPSNSNINQIDNIFNRNIINDHNINNQVKSNSQNNPNDSNTASQITNDDNNNITTPSATLNNDNVTTPTTTMNNETTLTPVTTIAPTSNNIIPLSTDENNRNQPTDNSPLNSTIINNDTSSTVSTSSDTINNISTSISSHAEDTQQIPNISTTSTSNTSSNNNETTTLKRSTRPNFGKKYEEVIKPLLRKNFNLTVHEALEMDKDPVTNSIISEFNQMNKLNVFEPVDIKSKFNGKYDVIPARMLNKKKVDANGNHIKWKSRLVAGGHLQTCNSFIETSSPTLNISTLNILCNVALNNNMRISCADVIGAYLNSPLTDNIFMRINKTLTPFLIKSNNKYKDYVREDGTILVQLKKALYGLKQSGKLWYNTISSLLMDLKFKKSQHDECLFILKTDKMYILIGLYVDDLFIVSDSESSEKYIIKHLQNNLLGVTLNTGEKIDYLGMKFHITKDKISITMNGLIEKLLEEYKINKSVATPTNANAFKINTKLPLLEESEQKHLHSTIYKLLYLSNRIRPDLSPIINFLCTRANNYTLEDKFKLNRILKYLHGTKNLPLTFTKSNNSNLQIYADASHAIHSDSKGHSGLVIKYNDNLILFKSRKQKINTMSSTESELVCISDSISYIHNILNLFNELKINLVNKTIYQDNMSTIKMIENEKSTSQRTKHINNRYFLVKERIKNYKIQIKYLETENMIADILTKPLYGNLFNKFRNNLLNITE